MLLYTALFDQKRRSWVQVKLVVTEKRELVQPRLMYEKNRIYFTALKKDRIVVNNAQWLLGVGHSDDRKTLSALFGNWK